MKSNPFFHRSPSVLALIMVCTLSMMSGCSQKEMDQKESVRLTERGNSAIAENEWDDAVRFFSEAVTKNPSNIDALYGRSSVRMATGKEFYILTRAAAGEGEYNQAREIAQKADRDFGLAAEDAASILKIDPNSSNAYYILGCIAIYQGDWNSALDAFSSAIERNPKMASAYQRRGEVYGYINDSENEITDLKRAAELGYISEEDAGTAQGDGEETARMANTEADDKNFKF